MNDKIKAIIGAVTGVAVLALFFYEDIKSAFKSNSVSKDREEILKRAREAKAVKADMRVLESMETIDNKQDEETKSE